jgi:hypothetical protein
MKQNIHCNKHRVARRTPLSFLVQGTAANVFAQVICILVELGADRAGDREHN